MEPPCIIDLDHHALAARRCVESHGLVLGPVGDIGHAGTGRKTTHDQAQAGNPPHERSPWWGTGPSPGSARCDPSLRSRALDARLSEGPDCRCDVSNRGERCCTQHCGPAA
ncbi:hypothetical protein G6F68_019747 [Rhizopus microsporus]|nr:hypothetical protein G6F68_019747 [Rhizopus microsporus]